MLHVEQTEDTSPSPPQQELKSACTYSPYYTTPLSAHYSA